MTRQTEPSRRNRTQPPSVKVQNRGEDIAEQHLPCWKTQGLVQRILVLHGQRRETVECILAINTGDKYSVCQRDRQGGANQNRTWRTSASSSAIQASSGCRKSPEYRETSYVKANKSNCQENALAAGWGIRIPNSRNAG